MGKLGHLPTFVVILTLPKGWKIQFCSDESPSGEIVAADYLRKIKKSKKSPVRILNFEAWPIPFFHSEFEAFLKPFPLYNSIY